MDRTLRIQKIGDLPYSQALCARLLALLPDWFGSAEVNAEYVADLAARSVFVARRGGVDVGIMALTPTSAAASDIHLIAVHPDHHAQGIGAALIAAAQKAAKARGANFLTVKTLGPSLPNSAYAKTLAFYKRIGFEPLEEFIDFWGELYPMLLLIKPVG